MKTLRIITCAVLSILLVAGLARAAGTVLKMPDNGKEIQVRAGEVIGLALEEQGGTGYTWEFDHLDKNHFQVVGSETRHPSGQALIGGPVLRIWRLKAIAPGNVKLSLNYLRPWEGRAKAVKHFEVTVCIQ